MGQLVHAIKGIGEACLALDFPIVSGNVSLYNETNGRGILPTPTIGGVGLIDDWSKMARIRFAAEGEAILLIGAPTEWGTHLGQSVYLRDLFGRAEGPAPKVDLTHERKVGDFVRKLVSGGTATAAHDLSDGGLAIALAEMAIASGIGADIGQPPQADAAAWFGEDQGRYLLTVPAAAVDDIQSKAAKAGVNITVIGSTGGDSLKLAGARAIPVSELKAAHEGWFPAFMAA